MATRVLRRSTTLGALVALLSLPAVGATGSSAVSTAPVTLAQHCPPGFSLDPSNGCKLHSLYDQYNSLYNRGVGGLKTALPARRDGFSPEQIDLGRILFFDPILSGDHSLSCASCHHPQLGFADGLPRSQGIAGKEANRAAPSLWNMAFLTRFFWDARAQSLEEQMQGPLYSPVEMGNNPAKLLTDLNNNAEYQRLFKQAFPAQGDSIDLDKIYLAIAAFETSLISLNSRYDRYAQGFHAALNEEEKQGLNVFRSFVARCAECHTPPLFTNQQIAVIGVAEPEGRAFDRGAEEIFNNPTWRGGFKVPSLRNITKTAPYMHSGSFETLREATEFYTLGRGHALTKEQNKNMVLHWHIWEPKLTESELDLLVTFMGTLSDETFTPNIPTSVPSGLPPVGQLPPALRQKITQASQGE